MRVDELLSVLEEAAPAALAEDWDNIGLMVGRRSGESAGVLVALDLRAGVIAEARERGWGIILTHHPLVFPALASVTPATSAGGLALEAAEAGIAVIAAHTNLDAAPAGLNDLMAGALGLENANPLAPAPANPAAGLGRIGTLASPEALGALAARAEALWPSGVRLTGDPERPVERLALCTGSGASLIDTAREMDADAYMTCDLKYHDADRAEGMPLVGLDHAAVEGALLAQWAESLRGRLALEGCGVAVAARSTSPWSAPAPR